MKPMKKTKEWHSSNAKIGSGDYYGTGVRNPVGTIQRDYLNGSTSKPKKMKPPKSLA